MLCPSRPSWLLLVALGAFPGAAALADDSIASPAQHPVVPGFERFYAASDSNPLAGGQLLLGELNCTSCHAADERLQSVVLSKQAPVLDEIGARARPEWLRAFIASPHETKPGTTMPALFGGLSHEQKREQVEALVHLLASTGSSNDSMPDRAAASRGRQLFHRVGCTACHDPQEPDAPRLPTSVPLGDLAAKYTIPALTTFLRDPLHARPSGRMPAPNLKDDEVRDVVHYLLREIEVEPNLRFAVYEGSWNELPDFTALKPKSRGEVAGFDLGAAEKPSNFGMRFEGFLHVPRDGQYTFYVGSDDGSRLTIDGRTAVDVDGVHPYQQKSGRMELTAGAHPVSVDYFQGGGEWVLTVEWEGPGTPRQALDGAVTLSPEPPKAAKQGFAVYPALVEKGRGIFASAGCASCHQLKQEGKPIESRLASRPVRELSPEGGCLSPQASATSPRYALNEPQRAALTAVLKASASPPEIAPQDFVHQTMAAFNCYACHTRGEAGGPEAARDAFFETTQPEMGDEGRIPPPLTGVGDKLNRNSLRQILDKGASDRPYMHARMPRYGLQNVGRLADAFETLDAKTLTAKPEFPEPLYRIKSAGRHLVGAQVLSCIKCHDFGPHESTGIRAMNLTKIHQRLREDWFARYMVNPQEYRPGTRMPSAWPFGQSTVHDVLDGDPALQIRAVWEYLADGAKAAVPVGLLREPLELKAETEPIIYRNFIEGAGVRAIGVGYPEGVNLAFDADNLRLALIWHGAFIDASRHWNGRGQGFEPPLGDHILGLSPQTPFAVLEDAASPWPSLPAKEQGYRFRGYGLGAERRPSFHYEFAEIVVTDTPEPILAAGRNDPNLRRLLTLQSSRPPANVWFRAAEAGKIEELGEGWYRIDSAWKLRVESGASSPIIRTNGDKSELLVPIVFTGNQARITQEFEW